MPQADGSNKNFKRIALQLGEDVWYRFKVNPASYTDTQPQRATIFKTKSNVIIEDFGEDLGLIAFSGTTGFKKDELGRTGADRIKDLQGIVSYYAQSGGDGNTPDKEFILHNFTDDYSTVVHLSPEGIKIERSVDQPLLYTYTLSLVKIRRAGIPPDREQVDPEIGNTNPSIGGDTANATRSITQGTAVNPRGTAGAYELALKELKTTIGYGEG